MVRVRPAPTRPRSREAIRCAVRPTPPPIALASRTRGLVSGFLHQSIREGSHLEVSAPRGAFTLAAGVTPVVLISAGIGVTPMLAMLHGMAATSAEKSRQVWWLHSARDRAHHSFAAEADDLLAALPASRRRVIYSRPAPGDVPGRDFDRPGHLSLDLLHELGVPEDADFYLCGPPGFLEDFQKGLAAWGIPWPRVHVELFGARARPARRASPAPRPYHIVLTARRAADPW